VNHVPVRCSGCHDVGLTRCSVCHAARSDDWVVLVEHVSSQIGAPIDPDGMQLVFFEQVLLDAGIDASFAPFRPGEGGVLYTQAIAQPVRLMVKAIDLERARTLAREALAQQQ
jgi:hypothetical protein